MCKFLSWIEKDGKIFFLILTEMSNALKYAVSKRRMEYEFEFRKKFNG